MKLRPLLITEDGDNPKADFYLDSFAISLNTAYALSLFVGVVVSFWILLA